MHIEPDPSDPLLVICGDLNGRSDSGAVRYAEDGYVTPDFREDGHPVSSKDKRMRLGSPLMDARASSSLPPPTLVVSELISIMVKKGGDSAAADGDVDDDDGGPHLSDEVLTKLDRIYRRYATTQTGVGSKRGEDGPDVRETTTESSGTMMTMMNAEDVGRWFVRINGRVGRGIEFRSAAREMRWVEDPEPEDDVEGDGGGGATRKNGRPRIILPPDGLLSYGGFVRVYERELRDGKFWGIAHDLSVLGEPLPNRGLFGARFDRIYHSSSLSVVSVLDTVLTEPCPNGGEPSDHLPVAASFECRAPERGLDKRC